MLPGLFVGDKTLDLSGVGLIGNCGFTKISLSLCGLLVKDVGFVSVSTDRLAVLGKLETLLGA